jgi:hypothetical protein
MGHRFFWSHPKDRPHSVASYETRGDVDYLFKPRSSQFVLSLIEFGLLVLEKTFEMFLLHSYSFAIISLGEGQSPSFVQT